MSFQKKRKRNQSGLEASSMAYWTIRSIHDNPILPLVRNPYKILEAAGIKKGQTVFEVGCGPGFFTIPAAQIVGGQGHVYACDIQPRFVARVNEKMEKEALVNITPMCINASNTGLPDKSAYSSTSIFLSTIRSSSKMKYALKGILLRASGNQ